MTLETAILQTLERLLQVPPGSVFADLISLGTITSPNLLFTASLPSSLRKYLLQIVTPTYWIFFLHT